MNQGGVPGPLPALHVKVATDYGQLRVNNQGKPLALEAFAISPSFTQV